MSAAAIGAVAGLLIAGALYRSGMLRERSGLAVLLAAIAFFYPVFAAQAGAPLLALVLHSAVFITFAALAVYGFHRSSTFLAWCLVAHGVFDGASAVLGHSGPLWWPAFCGTLDITAGGAILLLIRTRKIPE